jgi:hypothetical protein
MAKALLAFRKQFFSWSQIVIRSISIACEASDASLEETIMSQVVNGKYGHHCPGAWTRDEKHTQKQSEATSLGMHILVT